MKRKGDNNYMVDERDSDLMEAFDKLVDEMGYCYPQEVYEALYKTPAPRYYITGKRAYVAIKRMQSGKCNILPERERMYRNIEYNARQMLRSDKSLTMIDAVRRVVERPAPSFFLSVRTMMNIISWRSRRNEQEMREYRDSQARKRDKDETHTTT